jgi:hypothetical protein
MVGMKRHRNVSCNGLETADLVCRMSARPSSLDSICLHGRCYAALLFLSSAASTKVRCPQAIQLCWDSVCIGSTFCTFCPCSQKCSVQTAFS